MVLEGKCASAPSHLMFVLRHQRRWVVEGSVENPVGTAHLVEGGTDRLDVGAGWQYRMGIQL